MTIPINASAETLAWVINMPTPHDYAREEWKELEESGTQAKEKKSEYDDIKVDPVRSMLDEAKLWPSYSIGELRTWHSKRAVLIGDAAHGLPPNGLGTGLAFEDAAILTRLLVETKQGGRE